MSTELAIALVGVAGTLAGTLIGGGVSMLTGRAQRRHESERWRLDQRLAVYSDFSKATTDWLLAIHDAGRRVTPELAPQWQALGVAYHRLVLLAPPETSKAAQVVFSLGMAVMIRFDLPGEELPPGRGEAISAVADAHSALFARELADLQE